MKRAPVAFVAFLVVMWSLGACDSGGDGGVTPGGGDETGSDAVADGAGDAPADISGDEGVVPDEGPLPDVSEDADADASEDVAPDLPGELSDVPSVETADVVEDIPPFFELPELPLPELTWGACDTTTWPDGYPKPTAQVECATFEAPLDYGDPEGETITLRIGIDRSASFPTGKAIFHLAGGPGGAATYQSGTIPWVLGGLGADFDHVYLDQRGTGGSGRMDCGAGYPETADDWKACAAEHADRPLQHYLTVDAAHDIEYARRILGYETIYLRGGSYGTRVGLEYMRQHGDHVAAVVLDGAAPPDVDLLASSIAGLDRGIDLLVADCAADPACQAVAPDLLAEIRARRVTLQKTPRPISAGGDAFVEDEAMYIDLLGAFVYDAHFRYRIPRAIHAAVGGDNTLWNGMMTEIFGVAIADGPTSDVLPPSLRGLHRPLKARLYRELLGVTYVAPALLASVICAEWFPNAAGGVEVLEEWAGEQEWGAGGLLGLARSCADWAVTPIDEALRKPVKSSLPTLLLSGQIDMNTPAQWGEAASVGLSHATHIVIPYASHSTMGTTCGADLMRDFIEAGGDITEVDTSCVAATEHPGW